MRSPLRHTDWGKRECIIWGETGDEITTEEEKLHYGTREIYRFPAGRSGGVSLLNLRDLGINYRDWPSHC